MYRALSVDLGTTALKATIADENGFTISSATRSYDTITNDEGWAEQRPEAWWEALCGACSSLREAVPEDFGKIRFVSMCGQMHTHVYLDTDNQPLRTAITWMDQRSAGIVAEISSDDTAARTIRRCSANALTTTYTAPNIVWFQRNEPDLWRKTRKILVAKDYVKFLLTGEMAMDYSEAAGTLLFDVAEERWSDDLLRLFDVKRSMLPDTSPAATVIGSVTDAAERATGIPRGTPVINGATDNSTAALGAGVTEAGEATLIIGTAGVVSVCSDTAIPDPSDAVVCWNYALPGRWINLGVMQTAGESLNWFRRAFDAAGATEDEGDIFNYYNRLVTTIADGSDGVFFLPYLNGERTPHWDSNARGVFFGAGLGTEKAHFVKAVMEGVAMALRQNAETVEKLGQPVAEVRAIGGGLRSRPWLEILSRVLERPIHVIRSVDPAVRGNIALGRTALGEIDGVAAVVRAEAGSDDQYIAPPGTNRYDRHYELFLRLYEQLAPLFVQRAEVLKRW
jgi:xylulokinase